MSEDRENEEKRLGELPSELSIERNDLPEIRRGSKKPIDITRKPYNAKVNIGTVTQSTRVTSTFSTRPISSFDFVRTNIGLGIMQGDPQIVTTTIESKYTIPQDRVAVITGFKFQMIPFINGAIQSLGDPHSPVHMNIRVDGTAQQGYTNMDFGTVVTDWVETHIICPPGSVLSLVWALRVPTSVLSINDHVNIRNTIKGTALKSRALPPEMEVGNLLPSKTKVYREGGE